MRVCESKRERVRDRERERDRDKEKREIYIFSRNHLYTFGSPLMCKKKSMLTQK